jgi:hypothetical protein
MHRPRTARKAASTFGISGEREHRILPKVLQEEVQIGRAASDVFSRVPGIGDIESARGRRHQLHQTLSALGAAGFRLAGGFDCDHRE